MSDPFIFKVMRLPSPSFRVLSACTTSVDGAHGDALTSLLQVSNSIGTVYCGEVFRCAVCAIANCPPNGAYDAVSIRCELHTTTARSACGEWSAPSGVVMSGGDKRDIAVAHQLNESGINCLVASVTFALILDGGPPSERRTFQKYFKFNVFDAVAMSAHARLYEQQIITDTTITNNTQKTLQIYAISLVTANPHSSSRVVSCVGGGDKSSTIQLESGASLNALFEVSDGGDTDIGRVHVKWRSLIGECGKLKSALIQRPNSARPTTSRDVEWTVVSAPATAVIEEPFAIAIRLKHTAANAAPLTVRISFVREKIAQIVPFGAAQAVVQALTAESTADVVLTVLPIQVGVQKIGGLRLAVSANGTAVSAVDIDTLHYVDVRPNHQNTVIY